jgi:hypothetical protein
MAKRPEARNKKGDLEKIRAKKDIATRIHDWSDTWKEV